MGYNARKTTFFPFLFILCTLFFCCVQKLMYLCTKFCKLCNEFNTKFQLVY